MRPDQRNVRRILFLLSDGRSTDYPEDVKWATKLREDRGIEFYSYGLGEYIDWRILRQVTSRRMQERNSRNAYSILQPDQATRATIALLTTPTSPCSRPGLSHSKASKSATRCRVRSLWRKSAFEYVLMQLQSAFPVHTARLISCSCSTHPLPCRASSAHRQPLKRRSTSCVARSTTSTCTRRRHGGKEFG